MFGNPLQLRSLGVTALTVGALASLFTVTASASSGASSTTPASGTSATSVQAGQAAGPGSAATTTSATPADAAYGSSTEGSAAPGQQKSTPKTSSETQSGAGATSRAATPAGDNQPATPDNNQPATPDNNQPATPDNNQPATPDNNQPATPPATPLNTTSPGAAGPATNPPAATNLVSTLPVAASRAASRPVVMMSLMAARGQLPSGASRVPSEKAGWHVALMTNLRRFPAGQLTPFSGLVPAQIFRVPAFVYPGAGITPATDARGLKRTPQRFGPIAHGGRSDVAPLTVPPILHFARPMQNQVPIGGASVGASGGIGTAGPPAIAFAAVLVLVALSFLPKRLALNPPPCRSTLLAMQLERPG
jgi:hypothetical protein